MGQRHQVIIKYCEKEWGKNEEKIKRICFHNQWLYGRMPLLVLGNIIKYQKKAEKKYKLNNGSDDHLQKKIFILHSLMTTNSDLGKIFNFINVGDIGINHSDNNNGWTLIDLTKESGIEYAFVGGSEELEDQEQTYVGVDAETYWGYSKEKTIEDFISNNIKKYKIDKWIKEGMKYQKIIMDNASLMKQSEISFFK